MPEQAADDEAADEATSDYDDGYYSDGLESACARGEASEYECFGPEGAPDTGDSATGYENGLHGYQQCGWTCEQEPSSGDLQYEYGCEQGYIAEGC